MAVIFDSSDGQELRINTIGSWLRREFGEKVIKLSIDAGFTCPNRDGCKGNGGCVFCSDSGSGDHAGRAGSGDHAGRAGSGGADGPDFDVRQALGSQIELLASKWPDARYIAYFQSNTNTYAPMPVLDKLYRSALSYPGVSGLAIATRPDCLSEEILDLLEKLNRERFLWVELGLQSIHENTMEDMNLRYTLEDYRTAVSKLHERGIRVVTHLILGLPGETRDMMLESIRYVCRPMDGICGQSGDRPASQAGDRPASPTEDRPIPSGNDRIFGLKLHMLNVVSDSAMPDLYPGYVPFESIDEYTDLVVDALELIPPEITIHRIYADAPKETLISPPWARQKRLVLNDIHKKLRDRDTWQGRKTE